MIKHKAPNHRDHQTARPRRCEDCGRIWSMRSRPTSPRCTVLPSNTVLQHNTTLPNYLTTLNSPSQSTPAALLNPTSTRQHADQVSNTATRRRSQSANQRLHPQSPHSDRQRDRAGHRVRLQGTTQINQHVKSP